MPESPTFLFDITLKLSSKTLVYPGDSHPMIKRTSDLIQGDPLTISKLSMNCHVGTHVDAPAHFLADGAILDELPLESFYGPAVVVHLEGRKVIEVGDLKTVKLPEKHHIILRTPNSSLLKLDQFTHSFCALSQKAAEYLCSQNPLSIGYDYYSLDPYTESGSFPAHKTLARANIPAFVCLDLSYIAAGKYVFAGLPLRLAGAEASPVRALLIKRL